MPEIPAVTTKLNPGDGAEPVTTNPQSQEELDAKGADEMFGKSDVPVKPPELQPTPTPQIPEPHQPDVQHPEDEDAPQDGEAGFRSHLQMQSEQSDAAEADAMFGGTDRQEASVPSMPGATPSPKSKSTTANVAMDVMHGLGESTRAIRGGVQAALVNGMELGKEVSTWVEGHIPANSRLSKNMKGVDQFRDILMQKLKDNPAAETTTVTSGIIKSTAQFLTGFYMGGKALSGIKGAGAVAGTAKAMAQGAIADFTAFDGHDKRFSNMVEEWGKDYPVLHNAVTSYLAASPNDTQIEGRLKNALEGAGLGVATEGVIRGVKYIAQMRALKATDNLAARVAGENVAPEGVKPEDFAILGVQDGKALETRATAKVQEGLDETINLKPSDVKGKPKSGDEVYINFATMDSPDAVKQTIKKMAMEGKAGIEEAQRGTRTWEQTKLSAQQEDAWKILMERRTGEAMNAEQSLASRQLWASSAEKLKDVATLAASTPTEANLFNFRKMLAIHYSIQKEVIAARTETARALQAWQIPAGSSGEVTQQISAMLESAGGVVNAQKMASKISRLAMSGNDAAIEKFVEKGLLAKTGDAIAKTWINGLLTNAATHTANALSNFAAPIQQIYERGMAELISSKLGTTGGVEAGEALAMLHAKMSTWKDALITVAHKTSLGTVGSDKLGELAAKTPKMAAEKIDAHAAGAYESLGTALAEKAGYATGDNFASALNVLDWATDTPARLMSQSDNFFKMMGYRMELHAQAVRTATQELRGGKLDASAFKERIAQIIENPPADIRMEAINQATYQTFTQKPDTVLKDIGDAIHKVPVLGRMVLPFKNTPINIMTYTFERTPLAPLVKTWRAEIQAGGARADIAMARMSTGTMVMMTAMDAALSGQITGRGPTEPGQRGSWMREDFQPYSMKIGNTWTSFSRVDPVGFTMGIGADLAEAIVHAQDEVSSHDFEQAMVAATFAISNNVLSKTYMQGVSEIIAAINNPQMKGMSYAKKIAGTGVPAGVASMARTVGIPGVVEGDPYMRVADDMVDALRRRIPGLSKDLPLYRDLWGRPVDYRSGVGKTFDVFSPIYLKTQNPEPIDKEMQALKLYPDMPDHKMSVGGVPLQLDGKQYSRMVELAGNGIKNPATGYLGAKDFLNQLVTGKHVLSPIYEYKKDRDKQEGTQYAQEYIRHWIGEYRNLARRKMMTEDAGLRTAYDEKTKLRTGRVPSDLAFPK